MPKVISFPFPQAIYLCIATLGLACQNKPSQQSEKTSLTLQTNIIQAPFGTMPDGRTVDIFTLTNKNGLEARITNLGGIIVALEVPDRQGQLADVVLGFDSLPPYLHEHPYFGAIVGRYGNRIAKGKFSLNGQEYTLATNNGPNHLHGGLSGFDKYLWDAETNTAPGEASLVLSHFSPDGDEGYPGDLHVQVTYTLTDANELRIFYAARTDLPTVLNLTNHAYFNLSGNPAQNVLGQLVAISADAFLPVDDSLIPTGVYQEVAGTPFDFRKEKTIGQDMRSANGQLQIAGGYDHCWVLRKNGDNQKLQLAATAFDPASGRVLEVLTTEPGIQFYTGNFLDGKYVGKGGKTYHDHAGFCLETQHFPDSPNQPAFPSTVLRPGDAYRTTTVYRFSVRP